MKCKNYFNPECDIQPVDQFGFIDLAKANATGVIDVPLDSDDNRYNMIDDPRSIGARPADIFEAMQANVAISSYDGSSEDKSE